MEFELRFFRCVSCFLIRLHYTITQLWMAVVAIGHCVSVMGSWAGILGDGPELRLKKKFSALFVNWNAMLVNFIWNYKGPGWGVLYVCSASFEQQSATKSAR